METFLGDAAVQDNAREAKEAIWFIGLGIDDPAWDATTFTKNRDRRLNGTVAHSFLAAVLAILWAKQLSSSDHFSVDGALIEA